MAPFTSSSILLFNANTTLLLLSSAHPWFLPNISLHQTQSKKEVPYKATRLRSLLECLPLWPLKKCCRQTKVSSRKMNNPDGDRKYSIRLITPHAITWWYVRISPDHQQKNTNNFALLRSYAYRVAANNMYQCWTGTPAPPVRTKLPARLHYYHTTTLLSLPLLFLLLLDVPTLPQDENQRATTVVVVVKRWNITPTTTHPPPHPEIALDSVELCNQIDTYGTTIQVLQ